MKARRLTRLKTADLTGLALEWAVASIKYPNDTPVAEPDLVDGSYAFTTQWSEGGPIIEREHICAVWWKGLHWVAGYDLELICGEFHGAMAIGATCLQAAMRAFVRKHRGDEIDVPEVLLP